MGQGMDVLEKINLLQNRFITDGIMFDTDVQWLLNQVKYYRNELIKLQKQISGKVEEKPRRSTGWKSQNHQINGHVQQICEETGNDFHTVKNWCKEEAISEGYPFDTFKEKVIPWSESRLDTVQAGILIEVIHRLAAELIIILKEDSWRKKQKDN